MPFSFEALTVYQKSLDVIDQMEVVGQSIKGRISFSLLDQLSRASTSVALNIAEGNGRWHKNDKKQFLRIAQGLVFEMVPILQVIYRRKLIEKPLYDSIYEQLIVIAKMLTNLIKSVDDLKRS